MPNSVQRHATSAATPRALLAACSCAVMIGLLAGMIENAHAQNESVLPPWQRGTPVWNGHGYDSGTDPPPPQAVISGTNTAAFAQPTGAAPYTLPVDPASRIAQRPEPAELQLSEPHSQSLAPQQLPPPSRADDQLLPEPRSAPPTDSSPAASSPEVSSDTDLEPVAPIGEVLDTAEALAAQPPLHEEAIRWYQYPVRWMRGWNSHAEFGLDGSEGNARTLAIQTGLETKRQTDTYTLAFDIDYRQASSRSRTVEDNGRFNADFDRLIGDSQWSAFSKLGMEWDRFKAFDLRLNLNSGLGYYWLRNDTTTFVTRFGAGASREFGAPEDEWIPEAVFGIEAERQLSSRQKIKGKVEYFPAWENFNDYRIVTDLSWEILLDSSDNLSLKLAATDRYDSTPQGAEANDLYYSLLLLYKF